MAIIYSYPDNTNILLTDLLIGTSTVRIAGKKKNLTKNFTVEALGNFISLNNPTVWGTIDGNLEDQTDLWNALQSKQGNITLTTSGVNGPSTFIADVLNIPDYSAGVVIPTLAQVLLAGNAATNNITLIGNVTASSFIKTGGTNLQYLMADGSVTTGGGAQTLQQVTDVGNTTTNSISIIDNGLNIYSSVPISGFTYNNQTSSVSAYFTATPTNPLIDLYQQNDFGSYGVFLQANNSTYIAFTSLYDSNLNLEWSESGIGGSVNLTAGDSVSNGGKITFYDNDNFGSIRVNDITANVILEFPNKVAGTYTIATTDDIPSITPAALTKTDDTNVTLTLGGTPNTALLEATSLTLGWTGTLADSRIASATTWNAKQDALSGTGFVKSTAGVITYDTSTYTPTSRTLTINGVGYDLSADRSWTISTSPLTTKGDLYTFNTANARLPVGLDNQVLISDSTQPTGLKWSAPSTPTPLGYYGAFQDMLTQTLASANVGQPFLIRTVDEANQVSITANGSGQLTRITPANTGVYNIQWSGQFQNPTNDIHNVNVWFRKGLTSSSGPGTDVVGSNGVIALPARKSAVAGEEGRTVSGWNFLLSIAAGEYVEFYWMSNSTQVTLQAYPAGSPPPSTASLIVTITQQSGIMAGTGMTSLTTTGTSGPSTYNSLTGTLNVPQYNGSPTIKLTSQTLTVGTWILVGGYYTYAFSNANVDTTCDVSVTPQNASYLTAYNAQVLPFVGVAAGVATFYSQFPPQADMIVDIVITQTA